MQNVLQHVADHWGDYLSGGLAISALGHAVSTFPVPQNVYGRWLLGTIQFIVGQRIQATATKEGTTLQQQVAAAVIATDDASSLPGSLLRITDAMEANKAKKDS